MKLFVILLVALLLAGGTAWCVDFKTIMAGGKRFTTCRVNLDTDKLQLFLNDDEGRPFKSFDAVMRWLEPRKQKLVFAMNAGMFHANFSPVGLFVRDGREIAPLNLEQHPGNFFLKPNGVFFINDAGAHITESTQYPAVSGRAALATQSGPLLVIDGKLHPAFQAGSESRLFRNGVGILSSKEVVFVISEEPVNFYEFAVFFRDGLKCKNALFLDGTLSSLYSEELKRSDKSEDLGPIIGVVSGR